MCKLSWMAVVLSLAVSLTVATTPACAQFVDVTAPGNPIIGVAATVGSATSTAATVGTLAGVNNYPANEAPPNAIDNVLTTKYLNFQQTGSGFIVSPGSSTITAFRFATANDATERDPITISIEGTNSPNATTTLNSTWSTIYSGDSGLLTDPGRDTFGSQVDFTNIQSFVSYRVLVSSVRDTATANSMQFGEVELLVPVPEPSSMVLLGIGVCGWIYRDRRRKAGKAA